MNILFVGNKDIAGRYTADKLYKENHKIYWLTELEDGELWDSNVKGKIYRTDITTNRCKDIFLANNIDTVIFLTGKHKEYCDNQYNVDYASIIPGLMNILKISKEYNVNKFVFFSSMELCRNYVSSPVLADLMSGEIMCNIWKDKFKMPILILRISSIYGVYDYDDMDYTGYIYSRMMKNKNIETSMNRKDNIDLIYGEDAADSIYRYIKNDNLGTFQVYNGHSITAEKYFEILSLISNYDKKVLFASEASQLEKIVFDKSPDNMRGTWKPFYNFEDNISNVIEKAAIYNRNISKCLSRKESDNKKANKLMKNVKSLGENILLFILSCILLKYTQKYTDFRFVDVRLVYVVIISCIYGMRQGMIASVFSCISYGYSIVMSGIDLSYLLYSIDTWTPFVMYLITGSTVGYIVDVRKDELEEEKNQYKLLDEKYIMLKGIYKEVCDIKNQLQRQIIASKNSFWRVYEIVSELDTFKPELIFFKAINILEDVMETDAVSIYTVNADYLNYARLMANSLSLAGKLDSSLRLDDYPLIKESVNNREMFVNKQLLDGYPTYAAPILDGEKVVAIAMTYNTGLERFTRYYQNLFRIIIEMIQSNLVKAYRYSKASYEQSYIDGTNIYNPQEFKEQMRIVKMAHEEINLPYIMGKVRSIDGSQDDISEFSRRLRRVLRNTDFIGCDDNNNYYVVLMQTNEKNFDVILDRFKKAGLELIREESD